MKKEDNVTINDIKTLVSEFKNRLEIATDLKCEINVFIIDKKTTEIDVLYNLMEDMFIETYKMSPKYINKNLSLNNVVFKNKSAEIIAYRQVYCYISKEYLNITPYDIVTNKIGIERTNGIHYIKVVKDLLSINDPLYTGIFMQAMNKIGKNEKIV